MKLVRGGDDLVGRQSQGPIARGQFGKGVRDQGIAGRMGDPLQGEKGDQGKSN